MEPMSTPTGTQAVDRATRLVTDIVEANGALTFSELCATTGLAKSTTCRLLLALERNGLVRRDDAGAYLAGELFQRYAWRSGRQGDLGQIAQPYLEHLGELTGETINLGITRRGVVEQIAQVDSRYVLGGTNWVGRPVPLHCTALGKVLLAFGAAELPPGRLERLTERTITNRAQLAAELAEVRRRGYAFTEEELEAGLAAIAAPIFRRADAAVAAISVSGPVSRLFGRQRDAVGVACAAEAAALSGAIRPPITEGGRGVNRVDRSRREGAA